MSGRPKGPTPRAYQHAELVYRAMAERAVPGPDGALVFHGNILPTMTSLGFTSRQQWHDLKRDLRAMGCVRHLRRGARYRLGAWVLLRPPTPALYEAFCRPLPLRELEAQREQHDAALIRFILSMTTLRHDLLKVLVGAGVRTPEQVIAWLGALPEKRLRAEFPEVCVGFHTDGAPHTCGVRDLDVLAPSHSAGAWKRRPTMWSTSPRWPTRVRRLVNEIGWRPCVEPATLTQ